MMHWGDYGSGIMGIGWIWMLLFWVLIICCLVYAIRTMVLRSTRGVGNEKPIDILKKRYARGEITKDEFDRMKDDLAKS